MSIENLALATDRTQRTLVVFATRWGAQFGGINSFNQDLLSAFAAVSHQDVKTVCVVLTADADEQRSALNEQVALISLDLNEESSFSANLESLVWAKLQDCNIAAGNDGTVWLGHDRITGSIAIAASKKRGGRSALIHHMSYNRYESFAEKSATAKRKEDEQVDLFESADIVMAVGPLLGDTLADIRSPRLVHTLIPGLPEIIAKDSPRIFKGFLSGRLSEDAKRIKQAHLGVAAFADAIRQSDSNSGLPDSLRGENEPMLILRGVDFENTYVDQHLDAEQELKVFAESYADRAINLLALPFTTDRKALFDDLRNASAAMMPSWHEGFGLVAWEAIAAGVPLIVSKKSGVYRHLKDFNDGVYLSYITSIDIAGSNSYPYFLGKDVSTLAQALIDIAKDARGARQKAARLREALISEFTWAQCARQVALILEWQPSEHMPDVQSVDMAIDEFSIGSSIDLIDLPVPRWSANSGLSDSQLLRAEEAIIAFDHKRDPFLESQQLWAASQYPIAIRLLTGAGGVGKTRLALELCNRLKGEGWESGFLLSECESGSCEKLVAQIIGSDRPCCVVIDYAETRQDVLLAMLKCLLRSEILKPVRILLLARDGGEWWTALSAKDPSCEPLLEGDATSGPFVLPLLHDSQKERQEAYLQALKTFGDLLGVVPSWHVPNLDDAHFVRPLYIQMAALMSLRGERPRSAEALQRAVVNHEKRYWGKLLSLSSGVASDYEQQASLLMTLATLANGISTERSIEKAWIESGQKKHDLHRVFAALSSLYPDRQGLHGLRPDLIGESLVAQTLLASAGSKILDVIFGGEKKVRLAGLTVIARLLRNRADLNPTIEDALTRRFSFCIDEVIAVCVETPSPLPDIVQNAFEKLPKARKLQLAGVISQRLRYEVLELTGLDVQVAKTIAERHLDRRKPQSEEDTARCGGAIMNLSIAYVRDGKIDESLTAARQAVDIYKAFPQPKSEQFKSGLANSFVTLANRLAEQGYAEEAVTTALQAVEQYRALNHKGAEGLSRRLAIALNCYGHCLDALGRADEASVVGKEVLDLYGQIDPETPTELKVEIAGAISNYATYLQAEGKDDQALAAAEKALGIFHGLALSGTNRLQSLYAMSLHNYSGNLASQGEISKALTVSEQALNIMNVMAELRPDRFQADLSTVLRGHGGYLNSLGRYEEGIAVLKKSLDICQELAGASFARFSTDLMYSLLEYSGGLANLGNIAESLVAAREGSVILDRFTETNPGLYTPLKESCRIVISTLEWLVFGKTDLERVRADGPRIKNAQMQRAVGFRKLCLLVWVDRDYDLISTGLSQFSLLNRAHRRGSEDEMFLLVALAEHVYGSGFISDSWRDFSERYRSQTGGRFPAWVVQIAAIHGVSL